MRILLVENDRNPIWLSLESNGLYWLQLSHVRPSKQAEWSVRHSRAPGQDFCFPHCHLNSPTWAFSTRDRHRDRWSLLDSQTQVSTLGGKASVPLVLTWETPEKGSDWLSRDSGLKKRVRVSQKKEESEHTNCDVCRRGWALALVPGFLCSQQPCAALGVWRCCLYPLPLCLYSSFFSSAPCSPTLVLPHRGKSALKVMMR